MPACTVCRHPKVDEINRSIAGGDSVRDVARRYSLSKDAVQRHKAHIPLSLMETHNAEVVARNDGLLGQMRDLQQKTMAILEHAQKKNQPRIALAAIIEIRRNLEMNARLLSAAARSVPPLPPSPSLGTPTTAKDWSHLNDVEFGVLGALMTKASGGEPDEYVRPDVQRVLDAMRSSD